MTANTVLSDINEIQCGYFLNGSKWYSDDAKRACEQRIKQAKPEEVADAVGLRHSYQEFKPHVTLAHGVDIDEAKQIAKELNAKLKMEPCLITMKGLVVEPIKDNWSDEL